MSNYTLSRITDVNGDNWNIKAKGLESQITIGGSSGGDVTGTTTSDLSGDTTFTLTIGSGKVTTSKIADFAVTNAKVADGAINWDKIATSVKNGTISGNYTEKLATCAQVKTYVDEAITGHGSYLGQKSVAEVNALTGMKNGDHVSVSDSGSITNPDGTSTSVNAGDNVIYDGTLRKWDCLAGDYKLKQTAKEIENTDSTKTISKVTQNENGEVSVTYQTIGKVSSATTADNYNPTSGTIKTALDSKLDDSQLITSWSGTASDSKIASEKLVKDSLDTKSFLNAVALSSSDDLDLVYGSVNGTKWYRWRNLQTGTPSNAPDGCSTALMQTVTNIDTNSVTQIVYPVGNANFYCVRCRYYSAGSAVWQSWKTCYYEATSTYSATGTQAINGTGVKAALDDLATSNENCKWIGCTSTSAISGGLQYWPLVKFSVSGNYWDIQFQISRTNKQFDDTNFETDNISISGYESNTDGQLKVGRIAFGPDGRGYGASFYQEHTTTGSGSSIQHWHTIYIKADWSANQFQWCKLDKVLSKHSVGSVTWLSYATAQTQPTTPLAATYIYPRVSGGAVGSSAVPVYVNGNGAVIACTDDFLHDGEAYTKAEVDAKNWLKAITIADDANLFDTLNSEYAQRTRKLFTCNNPIVSNGWPEASKTNLVVDFVDSTSWRVIAIVTGFQDEYYYVATKALSWKKVYYEATSTYSSTGTAPVNGTAVASAIVREVNEYHHTGTQNTTDFLFEVSADERLNVVLQVYSGRATSDVLASFANIYVRVSADWSNIYIKSNYLGENSPALFYYKKDAANKKLTIVASNVNYSQGLYLKVLECTGGYSRTPITNYRALTGESVTTLAGFTIIPSSVTITAAKGTSVGSNTKPVYVDSDGIARECGANNTALDVSISGTASKVSVGDRVDSAVPLVAANQNNLYKSWINQYHDASNGAILCVGEWNTDGTEKAQLRLRKGGNTATIKNALITGNRILDIPDASGIIALTSDIDSKFGLNATLLTASDDLNTLYRSSPGVDYYWWSYTSRPTNIPESVSNATCLMKLTRKHQSGQYCTQEIEVAGDSEYYFIRQSFNGNWFGWERVYRKTRKSNDVASFTTDDDRAYTGKAIAEYVAGAIGGNVGGYMGECSKTDVASHTFKMGDWFVASEAGTYDYTVSGTSKTIDNVVIGDEIYFTTDNELQVKPTTTYEKTANKVTTLDNSTTHYPSTSAVKTYVDTGIANLSNTYATKTELDSKWYSQCKNLTASDDLNNIKGYASHTTSWYWWGGSSQPSNRPDGMNNEAMMCVYRPFNADFVTQEIWSSVNGHYIRKCNNGAWDDWVRIYDSPRKSDDVASFSTDDSRAYTGKAIADHVSNAISGKENASNKVTSWQTTTDNTHYPSEKLVKDALDGKQATLSWDTTPTANSTKPVTSGGIRTYVDSKAYVSATTLTSANNLNSYCGSASTPVMWYKWASSSVPTNAPTAGSTALMEVRFFLNSSGSYCMQTVYIAAGEIYVRMCKAGTWDASWTRHYLDATSTYSSTGKQAVNGTAVASAINALDSSDSAVSNQFVTAVSETNGIISVSRAQPTISNVSGLQTALNGKEGSFTISYNSEEHALVFSKAFT